MRNVSESNTEISELVRYEIIRSGLRALVQFFSGNACEIVPIGNLCLPAYMLRSMGVRKSAYPFDWLFVNPNQIKAIINNDFSDFLDTKFLKSRYPERKCGHVLYGENVFFNHHNPANEPDRSAFFRRISRFRQLYHSNQSSLFLNCFGERESLLVLGSVLPAGSKIISFNYHKSDSIKTLSFTRYTDLLIINIPVIAGGPITNGLMLHCDTASEVSYQLLSSIMSDDVNDTLHR